MSGAHSSQRWRAPIGLALGALVFLVFAALMHSAVIRDTLLRADAHQSLLSAKGLAAVAEAAPTRASEDDLNRAAATYLDSIGASEPRARIIDLETRRLIVSSDPIDVARGPAPRALTIDEKPIYDRARLLAQAALVNAERARAVRAEESSRIEGDVRTGSAPITRDGRVTGMAEIVRAGASMPSRHAVWLWLTLGAIALAVGTYWLGATRSARWLAVAGLAALIATTAAWTRADVLAAQAQAEGAISATAYRAALATDATLAAMQWQGERPSAQALDADSFATSYAPARAQMQIGLRDAFVRSILAAGLLALALAAAFAFGWAQSLWRTMTAHRTAYAYLAPAFVGMIVLSIFPFLYGVALSFTDTTLLNQDASFAERFVGFANYGDILSDFSFTTGAGDDRTIDYTNFYWTLAMTIAWTIANVVIGVSLGLGLALVLNIKGLRGAGMYRVLLLLPWAIPNYITALTWKGIFHPQFGAANQFIQAAGGEPVAWFDSVWPSFMTGVITNGWLSFPFMMIVCLGALQSIDEDMYEAARIDGANPWQRFRHITLPALAPALLPAIIVSVVWTFNMFNVIYLVSAGQPGGSTEILITRAYKLAFEEYRYGYAAAYSVVIFALLLIYGGFQVRASKLTEGGAR